MGVDNYLLWLCWQVCEHVQCLKEAAGSYLMCSVGELGSPTLGGEEKIKMIYEGKRSFIVLCDDICIYHRATSLLYAVCHRH